MLVLKIIGATILIASCTIGTMFLLFCKAMSNASVHMKKAYGDF